MPGSKSERQLPNARLLIVDDNAEMVDVLEAMLKTAGYSNIVSTTDPHRALDLYQESCPDLILLDLMMPYWDGFQVMAQLKALTPDDMYLPILVLTGDDTPTSKERALQEGAKDFLTKPFDYTEVLLRIRNLLESRFLHLDLQQQNRALAEQMHEVIRHRREVQEALEALRESEERFRSTFEQAAVGLAHVAADGRLLRVNGRFCEIVGYSREELQQLTFQHLTHPDDLETDLEYVRQMLDGERQTYSMEKRYIHRNGQHIWVNLTVALVREGAGYDLDNGEAVEHQPGEPKYFISVVEDITLRKAAEESKRLYAQRLANLVEIDQAILSAGSPHEIISSTLGHLQQQLSFPYINIRLFDAGNGPAKSLFAPVHAELQHREDALSGIVDTAVLRAGGIQVIDNISAGGASAPLLSELAERNLRSFIIVPLLSQAELIGCLEMAAESTAALGSDDLEIAREVADRLAVALQDAQLYEQVRIANEQLQALSERLVEAQEGERRHLAHELHAEIGQALTVLHINLHGLRTRPETYAALIDENIALVERTLNQVRELSRTLRPAMLDEMGLYAALEVFVNNQAKRVGFVRHFSSDSTLRRDLPPRVEIACFRIAQEAFTNIMRHARATEVWVSLQRCDDQLRLCIQDNGVGFDVHTARRRATHGTSMGLLAMEERTRLAGGHIEIVSKPAPGSETPAATPAAQLRSEANATGHSSHDTTCGTQITVYFPLHSQNTDPSSSTDSSPDAD